MPARRRSTQTKMSTSIFAKNGCYDWIVFEAGVRATFSLWTTIKLAIEHGFGGRNTRDKVENNLNILLEMLEGGNPADIDDVIEFLYGALENDLNTVCEDDSVEEVAEVLVQMLHQCATSDYTLARHQLEQAGQDMPPTAEERLKAEAEQRDREQKERARAVVEQPADTSDEMEDDGWETVVSRKGRR